MQADPASHVSAHHFVVAHTVVVVSLHLLLECSAAHRSWNWFAWLAYHQRYLPAAFSVKNTLCLQRCSSRDHVYFLVSRDSRVLVKFFRWARRSSFLTSPIDQFVAPNKLMSLVLVRSQWPKADTCSSGEPEDLRCPGGRPRWLNWRNAWGHMEMRQNPFVIRFSPFYFA